MPLYDYICKNDKCRQDTFEVITNYEEKIQRCPVCKEKTIERKKFYQFDFRM